MGSSRLHRNDSLEVNKMPSEESDRSVADEYAAHEDVCGVICDAESEVSFIDE